MEKAFFMAEGLFDIQRVFRQDHPGVIGIQMVAGMPMQEAAKATPRRN